MISRSFISSLLAGLACLSIAGPASSDDKTLYFAMNGGSEEKAYREHVFPLFEQATGLRVEVVPGTSSDILAKLRAQKDNPQMHVVMLDDGLMQRAVAMGLCQKTAPSPAMNDLYPIAHFKDDMAIGVGIMLTGLGYNKKMFDEKGWAPPSSWMDLTDPKYKDMVVVQSAISSTFGLDAFLMYNRILGGDEKNVEPGFATWPQAIGPNVLEYTPNSAKIAQMAQTGEVAVFPMSQGLVWNMQQRGVPIAFAQPKEGSVLGMVVECVVANNPSPEAAQKLAAFLLTPEAQEAMLRYGRQMPSNRTAKAPPDFAADAAQFRDRVASAVLLDWGVINERRPVWNRRWNREIEQ